MKTFAKYLALLAVMAFFLTPIIWTVITAIKPTELISAHPIAWLFRPTLDHFRVIFFEDNILGTLINSTIIATLSTLGVLLTAAPASYALSRFRIPFGSRLSYYFLSARMAHQLPLSCRCSYFSKPESDRYPRRPDCCLHHG